MNTLSLILCTSILCFLLYSSLKLKRWRWRRHAKSPPLPPGPRPWPIIGNLAQVGPKPHKSMASMAEVYGPLMHLKMGLAHVVVASSAGVAEQFLKVHDANFSSRPPNAASKALNNYQDLVFAPYGPRWRFFRKITALHIFSAKPLDDFRHVRQEEVGILTRSLAHARQKPVRLGQMLNVCVTNAMSRVMLGKRVVGHGGGGDGDSKAEEFKEMVVELMLLGGIFNISDFIPILEGLDLQGVVAKTKKLQKRFDAFLSTILEEHKINGARGVEGHVDLLSTLISLKDGDDCEGGKLTDTEIKALLLNLFAAGTDTTSNTVEWAIAELIRHPEIMRQAQEEVDSMVGKNCFVTESHLSQLPFLQAIVKETFRLHPSTPLSLPRIADESCKVNGYFIPKGSTLLVNVWAIARDPNVWSTPLEFKPERFLHNGEKPNIDVKGNDFELIPFGAGRRICPGINLGIKMVQLLVATLIHAFNFDLENGELAETLSMEDAFRLTLERAEPLIVHPKPRLAPNVYL